MRCLGKKPMSVVYADDECVLFDLKCWFLNFLNPAGSKRQSFFLRNTTSSVHEPYFDAGKKFGPPTKLKFRIKNLLTKLKREACYFPYRCDDYFLNLSEKYADNSAVTDPSSKHPKRSEFYVNKKTTSICVEDSTKFYIFPPYSSFLICDIFECDIINCEKIKCGVEDGNAKSFDYIVADPPWTNKSVRRSSSYDSSYDLTLQLPKLPIHTLLNRESGFVFLWVTNNTRYQQFVLQQLLPCWNLVPLGCFVYVKLTTNGDPIFDVDSVHRQPYEYCVVCATDEWNESGHRARLKRSCHQLPILKFFFMIQPSVHSFKPPLHDFLKMWCPGNCGHTLELFSRSPSPNTVSLGNEIIQLFDKV